MNESAMPYNLQAERSVISILLFDHERIIEIADYLQPEDFYDSPLGQVWQAMASLYKQGQDIDVTSIRMELKKQEIDPKPALQATIDCYEEPESVGDNLMSFAKEVKNKSMLRRIIKSLNFHTNNSRSDDAQATKILSDIEKEVVNITDQIKDERPFDAPGILNEIRIDREKGAESGWNGVKTGFSSIDDITGGLLPTHTWIIGAYTGTGKTFFLLQIILNILKQGGRIVLFSTEMDRKMNVLRMLASLAGVGTINLLKDRLDEQERGRLKEAEKTLEDYKDQLVIYDNVYTVEEIRLKSKKLKLRGGLDVVLIDFIQNLRGAENIYERMSNAAIGLQQLAQELKVTMVVASQVSQASAGWSKKEAIEYKGAGEIAAVADVGIWITKDDDDKSARKIILRKVRHGRSDCFTMVRLSFPSGRVIEMGVDDKEDKEYKSAFGITDD